MIWRAPALCGFAESAGFVPADVPTAVAVALAASGGDDAYVARPWAGSLAVHVGLWQLEVTTSDVDATAVLLDPYRNAQAALAAFEDAGASWAWCDGWKGCRWVGFLPAATRAARAPARSDTVAPFGTTET